MAFEKFSIYKEKFAHATNFMLVHQDGTVIQTDFQPPINIPKVGDNIVDMVKHFRTFMDLCKYEGELYQKQVLETANMIVIFVRLDEVNHLGLFFKKDQIQVDKIHFLEQTLRTIEEIEKMKTELSQDQEK